MARKRPCLADVADEIAKLGRTAEPTMTTFPTASAPVLPAMPEVSSEFLQGQFLQLLAEQRQLRNELASLANQVQDMAATVTGLQELQTHATEEEKEVALSKHSSDGEQVVVFLLGQETYGINIASVQEIIMMPAITSMPGTPDYIEGVINLRGTVTPVMDLRTRYGQAHDGYTKDTRIIVVNENGQWVGLIVDSVTEVIHLSADKVEKPSELLADENIDCIRGVAKVKDDQLVILLDQSRMLSTV